MKTATDKQVEKWKLKYSNDLPIWFANVRAGEITISDLAKRMNISVEGARKYFYRYYSNDELVGTKYYTTGVKSEDNCATKENNLVDNSFNNQINMDNNLVVNQFNNLIEKVVGIDKFLEEIDTGIALRLDKIIKTLSEIKTKLDVIEAQTYKKVVGRDNFRFEKDDE